MQRLASASAGEQQPARGIGRGGQVRSVCERRIEDAATEFYVAADQRDGALAKVSEAESAMSRAIASLVTQDESVERIAALCGIQTSEVRRLRKLSTDTARAAHVSAKSTAAAAVLVKDTTSDNVAGPPLPSDTRLRLDAPTRAPAVPTVCSTASPRAEHARMQAASGRPTLLPTLQGACRAGASRH